MQRAQSQHRLTDGKHLEERKVWLNPSLISLKNISTPRGGSYGHEGPVALEIHLCFISALNWWEASAAVLVRRMLL